MPSAPCTSPILLLSISLFLHSFNAHSSMNCLLGLTASDLQAMEAITSKELKVLENVLDIEVPKLRRMVGPSMGAMGAVHSSRASLLE